MNKLFLLLLVLFVTQPASAIISPVSVGILPPLELPPDTATIIGARVSFLYGRQKSMYGVDLGGLGNMTYVDFGGIAVSGLFNVTHGMTNIIGLQAAGLTNVNTNNTRVFGIQFAGLFNSNGGNFDLYGFQVAPVNAGLRTVIRGAQIGIYNAAAVVYGFQIGVLNSTLALRGLQIGLINFNSTGLVKVCPILNAGF